MKISCLNTADADFKSRFEALLARDFQADDKLLADVQSIIEDVRKRGDDAVTEYTSRFDRNPVSAGQLQIPSEELQSALENLPAEIASALYFSADRIRQYHEKQLQESWEYTDEQGNRLGQKIQPLDRAGVYVPGGKAAYPSSVLMNVIPARVAGVKEVIMVVPCPSGVKNNLVMAAAAVVGVDKVYGIGGAQAVAALAYGTKTVPAVDKIVGPGNSYVAAAKRMVFGKVGIDMIAGPSEVLIVADHSANPDWVAMDLFAQAEHDEDARSILVSTDQGVLDAVSNSIEKLINSMDRADIISKSLENNGGLIRTRSMEESLELVNEIAPEHLELAVENPEDLLSGIRHAGAIFLGHYSAEVLGDYCAGPNHVLPTARTARFSSPLGVYDFQKRSSLIMCNRESVSQLVDNAIVLAYREGLTAHARSAEYRDR